MGWINSNEVRSLIAMIRTYTELIKLPTFEERYEYLRLNGKVGEDTFGFDRWINQDFYTSREWRKFRREIISRDLGCDLACKERPFLPGEVVTIHHMNPIDVNDIVNATDFLMNPEYVIATSDNTHRAIHYGDKSLLKQFEPTIRIANDTCPWR